MAEQVKKQEGKLVHIPQISSFLNGKMASVVSRLNANRKKLDVYFTNLRERKLYVQAELQAQRERQLAREQEEREKQEAIRIATSTPIIEPKVEVIVKVRPSAEECMTEGKSENKGAASTAKTKENASVATANKPKSEEQQKIAADLTAHIFAKAKKPVVEKPVIRIYVPPADEPRRRYNEGGNRRTGASLGQRNNDFRSRPAGSAPRSSAPRPILTPPPIMPTVGKDVKKKGEKIHTTLFDDKRSMSKKTLAKRGFVEDNSSAIEYDELSGEVKKIRTRKTPSDKRKAAFNQQQAIVIEHAVINSENVTIKCLSEKIGKTGSEILKKLFLLGIIKTINDTIDFDTADLVASEFGVTLELQHTETSEEKLMAYHEEDNDDPSKLVARPPIVTIMGHVDHGKTSILDYIRKSHVAAGEAGGITQHIGAYSIVVNDFPITFLDTPGHEAFTAMRARGANITDIVIIVVAADDGIMPQTVEAINHSKAAGVKLIVAVNKMDRAGADPDRVLNQLTEHGIIPDTWGGDVPVVKVSAKTGQGIDELLEMIQFVSEGMVMPKANPDHKAKGTIVEAKLDKGKGPVATILVQNGTLKVGDFVVAGSITGKIRAMQDDKGHLMKKAGPSMAVSVLGLQEVPNAGDQLMAVEDEKLMKQVADERRARVKAGKLATNKVTLDDVFKEIAEGKLKTLNLIIKADVQGSVEAIKESLIKLSNNEVKVSVIHAVAGAINESDVMLADTTGSIIIGFNVRPDAKAKVLAERDGIDIHLYRVIYDAIDDVEKAIKGLSAPKFREQYLGKAEVRVLYKISGVGTIAGSMVKDGKIVRNAKVRLVRDNIVITETAISSLKRMKDDVKEVAQGFECGIGLENYNDLKEGDVIESFLLLQENA